jgi:hypothetical protein
MPGYRALAQREVVSASATTLGHQSCFGFPNSSAAQTEWSWNRSTHAQQKGHRFSRFMAVGVLMQSPLPAAIQAAPVPGLLRPCPRYRTARPGSAGLGRQFSLDFGGLLLQPLSLRALGRGDAGSAQPCEIQPFSGRDLGLGLDSGWPSASSEIEVTPRPDGRVVSPISWAESNSVDGLRAAT